MVGCGDNTPVQTRYRRWKGTVTTETIYATNTEDILAFLGGVVPIGTSPQSSKLASLNYNPEGVLSGKQ
jgi:hypothetical protein